MLDPTEAGWLAKYLEIRREISFDERINRIENPERKYYACMHDSGFVFGHPIKLPVDLQVDILQWPLKDRMKVIYAEAFYSACRIFKPEEFKTEKGDSFLEKLIDFYAVYQPALLKTPLISFRKVSDPISKAEMIFDRRITVKPQWNASFWRGFFHNILLFVDVLHFIEWLQNPNQEASRHLRGLGQSTRLEILKQIALSASIDLQVNKQEQQLFLFFIESAELSKEKRQEAKNLLQQELSIQDLSRDLYSSWLWKKCLLELSILTLWADRKISVTEETFLLELSQYIDLDEIEMHSSILSVESFVMNNWERIHYLQEKQNFFILRKHLTARMAKVVQKYSGEIAQEIRESKELVRLFQLSSERELSTTEKEKIRKQLFDILKSIPAFVIFVLPFSFLTIPVLLKILPKSVFPSSFDPNRLNVKKRGNRTIDL